MGERSQSTKRFLNEFCARLSAKRRLLEKAAPHAWRLLDENACEAASFACDRASVISLQKIVETAVLSNWRRVLEKLRGFCL